VSASEKHKCVVKGCDHLTLGKFCHEHWFELPLKLRQKWWDATNYGKNEPPPELLAELLAVLS
jgi:hypothetical protein